MSPDAPDRPASPASAPPLSLRAYRGFARFPGPLLAQWLLQRRVARGKEDPVRLSERFGASSTPRPDGPVIWLHAASVGEALSALPLIDALRRSRPFSTVLLTTVTTTSAALMAERLPEGAIHQFAPVDTVEAVTAFLDHWRPDFLGVLESELWPTLIQETRARGARVAMISGRMSEGSAQSWGRAPRTIGWLLDQFDALLAQDAAVADRLLGLGADAGRVFSPGALKDAATPLPVDEAELAAMRAALGDRPVWLAASTHAGEETAAFEAHRRLAATRPRLLTLAAPRHPERADAVIAEAEALGLSVGRRSEHGAPRPEDEVFVIDRLGELGLWYRLAPLSFIGGSLDPAIGGHNLREAVRLGAAVLHGPYLAAFEADRARLAAVDGARALAVGETVAAALESLLDAEGRPTDGTRAMAARGAAAMIDDAGALSRICAALEPLLPPAPTSNGRTV